MNLVVVVVEYPVTPPRISFEVFLMALFFTGYATKHYVIQSVSVFPTDMMTNVVGSRAKFTVVSKKLLAEFLRLYESCASSLLHLRLLQTVVRIVQGQIGSFPSVCSSGLQSMSIKLRLIFILYSA